MTDKRKFELPKELEKTRDNWITETERSEHQGTIRDIRKVREKLEDFSLRDFAEAFYGEEFTQTVYGKEGGSIRMGDLKMDMKGTNAEGVVAMGLNEDQMIEIMQESHPGLTREAARTMLTEQGNRKAIGDLSKQNRVLDADHQKAFKNLENQTGIRMFELDDDDGKEGL